MEVSPSPLLALPTEVVELIALEVEPSDLLKLRRACKILCSKTNHVFAQEYFATLRTDLGPRSIQTLYGISRTQHLRGFVKRLVIGEMKDKGHGYQRQLLWCPRQSKSYLLDTDRLLWFDVLEDVVVNAFTNCRSFCIESWGDGLDVQDEDLQPADAVQALFSIIANTGIHVKSLDFSEFNNWDPEVGKMLFDLSVCRQPKVQEALSNVQDLRFSWKWECHDAMELVAELLANTSSLSSLYLGIEDDYGQFLDWKAEETFLAQSLQELHLQDLGLRINEFFLYFGPCRGTLLNLSLRFCILQEGDSFGAFILRIRNEFSRLEIIDVYHCYQREQEVRSVYLNKEKVRSQIARSFPSDVSAVSYRFSQSSTSPKSELEEIQNSLSFIDDSDNNSQIGVRYEGPHMAVVLAAMAEYMRTIP